MKPFVYIAGPYTHPEPVGNTNRAVSAYHELLDTGKVAAHCPHLSLLADFFHATATGLERLLAWAHRWTPPARLTGGAA